MHLFEVSVVQSKERNRLPATAEACAFALVTDRTSIAI
jgi:hypothetical protein